MWGFETDRLGGIRARAPGHGDIAPNFLFGDIGPYQPEKTCSGCRRVYLTPRIVYRAPAYVFAAADS